MNLICPYIDEKFPLWAKILLCIFVGFSGFYRIFLFVDDCTANKEEKNVLALVAGIICLVTVIPAFIVGIIDIISLCQTNRFAKFLR